LVSTLQPRAGRICRRMLWRRSTAGVWTTDAVDSANVAPRATPTRSVRSCVNCWSSSGCHNVRARGPLDTRPWVFVSHGNRRRRGDRLSPWTVWAIVKSLASEAEAADPDFLGLPAVLHTHDARHHFARTVLNNGANLSVVQDLLGHASPDTTKRIYATCERSVLRAAAQAHAPRLK
jgi:site-specific recombinase XerD